VSRAVTRLITVGLTGLVSVFLVAAPAFAADPIGPSEGADPGSGLGPAATLLLYVATPIGACLLIATVVLLPGAVRANRYRPAEGWSADPVWFAGPLEPQAAIATVQPDGVVRGGAHGSW
jgi:hypothetical protein